MAKPRIRKRIPIGRGGKLMFTKKEWSAILKYRRMKNRKRR